MPKIAICFFGITRSLKFTISSIEKNILKPAHALGEVRVFCHFFVQTEIDNPRSGEKGLLRQDEHTLLNPSWLELEEPDQCLAMHGFAELKTWGDSWGDDFRSLRNLVHQLHSLERVTDTAMAWQPDLVIFARPDLRYENTLGPSMKYALRTGTILLPNWQRWRGGYNDRFAITANPIAASRYGKRVHQMNEFCNEFNNPLHAELLLKYALSDYANSVKFRSFQASRVRLDGTVRTEDFRNSRFSLTRKKFRKIFRRFHR